MRTNAAMKPIMTQTSCAVPGPGWYGPVGSLGFLTMVEPGLVNDEAEIGGDGPKDGFFVLVRYEGNDLMCFQDRQMSLSMRLHE